MNKISNINTKDTVLDEIHSIQKKHYKERLHLSWNEQKKLIDNKVSKIEREYNIKFKIYQNNRNKKLAV